MTGNGKTRLPTEDPVTLASLHRNRRTMNQVRTCLRLTYGSCGPVASTIVISPAIDPTCLCKVFRPSNCGSEER